MVEELFEVIDEKEKVVGLKPRNEVHAKGLRHKGVYIIIFDEEGNAFLQQRAKNKDLMPSHWDFSVAEHLKPGESYEDAVYRGAMEELGIKVRNLKFVEKIDYYFEYSTGEIDNESNHFFVARFDGKICFKDGEVQNGKWIKLAELLQEMEKKPEKFTPWLLNCKELLENLKENIFP